MLVYRKLKVGPLIPSPPTEGPEMSPDWDSHSIKDTETRYKTPREWVLLWGRTHYKMVSKIKETQNVKKSSGTNFTFMNRLSVECELSFNLHWGTLVLKKKKKFLS